MKQYSIESKPCYPIVFNDDNDVVAADGLKKLEYFALTIYAAKIAKTENDNNSDMLIRQAIAEAKKLLAEIDKG